MPSVWMRADPQHQTRFHKTRLCRQLRKRPSRGESHELIKIDVADIESRPCLTCYPDAPRFRLLKRHCPTCDTTNACEHNGGIAVIDRRGRTYWVWPDNNQMPYYRRQARQQSA